jgi:hypothetical protein
VVVKGGGVTPGFPQRSSHLARALVLGFIATAFFDFALVVAIDRLELRFGVAVSTLISLVIGAVFGGLMFTGRPRHFGLAAAAGVCALVAATIGDILGISVVFVLHNLPLRAEMFSFFTTTDLWVQVNRLATVVAAAALTTLRIVSLRTGERRVAPPWGPPQAPYGPAQPQWPPQPWPYGQPPQQPYGQPQIPQPGPPGWAQPPGPQPRPPYHPPEQPEGPFHG